MCQLKIARSPRRASITGLSESISTAAFAVLMILMLASGCMRINLGNGAKLEIRAEQNSQQTVSIGDKRVNVPVSTTIPGTTLGY